MYAAVPLQAWSGPKDSRKFPDFMPTTQDEGKVVSLIVLSEGFYGNEKLK